MMGSSFERVGRAHPNTAPAADRPGMTASQRIPASVVAAPPIESAKAAGLRYTTDLKPGIRRTRRGRAFAYVDPSGKRVRAAAELARIRGAGDPAGLDATSGSAPTRAAISRRPGATPAAASSIAITLAGAKCATRTKYDRVIGFAHALPMIRRKTAEHLRRQGLPREKVLATVVQLLEKTLIRVGNDEYARSNRSYGLTTMRDGHVDVKGPRVRFSFRGKSGVEHEIDLQRPQARPDRQAVPRSARLRPVPVRGRERSAADGRVGRRQRLPEGDHRPGAHVEGLPNLGRHRPRRAVAPRVRGVRLGHRKRSGTSSRRSSRWRSGWGTPRRSAGSATSTRRCSTPIWMDRCWRRSLSARGRSSRAVDRLTAHEAAVLDLLQRRLARTGKQRKAS